MKKNLRKNQRPAANRLSRARSKRGPAAATQRVLPVAVKSSPTSNRAVIEAAVRSGPASEEAVIPVEVKTGESMKTRAAVIPIAVKTRHRPAKSHHRRPRQSRRVRVELKQIDSKPYRERTDPVTSTLVAATHIEQSAVRVAGRAGVTTIEMVGNLSRLLLRPAAPARRTERGLNMPSHTALPESEAA